MYQKYGVQYLLQPIPTFFITQKSLIEEVTKEAGQLRIVFHRFGLYYTYYLVPFLDIIIYLTYGL